MTFDNDNVEARAKYFIKNIMPWIGGGLLFITLLILVAHYIKNKNKDKENKHDSLNINSDKTKPTIYHPLLVDNNIRMV